MSPEASKPIQEIPHSIPLSDLAAAYINGISRKAGYDVADNPLHSSFGTDAIYKAFNERINPNNDDLLATMFTLRDFVDTYKYTPPPHPEEIENDIINVAEFAVTVGIALYRHSLNNPLSQPRKRGNY